MSNVYQEAIEGIEREIEAIEQRRGELLRVIDSLRPFAEEAPLRVNGKAKSAARGTNERTQASRQRAARSLPDDAEVGIQETWRRRKILAALMDGPLATRELAQAIHVDRKLTKMALQRMAKVGLIKGVGAGPARRWTLPGKPAKEAP